jgi:hypothetical protein
LTCNEFSCFYCFSKNGEHSGHDTKLLKDAVESIKKHNEELKLQLPNIEKTISLLKEEKNLFMTKVKEYIDSCDDRISFLQESFSNSKDLEKDPNANNIDLCLSLKMVCSIANSINGDRMEEIKRKFEELDEIMSRKENPASKLYTFQFDVLQKVVVKNGNEFHNGGSNDYTHSNVMSKNPIPPNSLCYFKVNAKNMSTCSFFGVIPEGFAGIHNTWLCSCGSQNKGYGIQGSGIYLENGNHKDSPLFSNSTNMDFGILVDTRNYTISLTYNNKFLKTYSLVKEVKYYPAMMIFSSGAFVTVDFPSENEVKKIFENKNLI